MRSLRNAASALTCVGLLACLSSLARADELTEAPQLPKQRSLTTRLETNFTELSLNFDSHLAALSNNLIRMRFDAKSRLAKLHLGGGSDETFALRLDNDVQFSDGYARIKTTIDLGLAGERYKFELPEFDMVPRSVAGERYVELRLPILKGQF